MTTSGFPVCCLALALGTLGLAMLVVRRAPTRAWLVGLYGSPFLLVASISWPPGFVAGLFWLWSSAALIGAASVGRGTSSGHFPAAKPVRTGLGSWLGAVNANGRRRAPVRQLLILAVAATISLGGLVPLLTVNHILARGYGAGRIAQSVDGTWWTALFALGPFWGSRTLACSLMLAGLSGVLAKGTVYWTWLLVGLVGLAGEAWLRGRLGRRWAGVWTREVPI